MDAKRRAQLVAFLRRIQLPEELHHLELLNQAMTHRSWYVEQNGMAEGGDNERLEFLGDAVIGLLTTEYLYRQMPDQDEGALSQLRAAMVSRKILGEIALSLEIGSVLLLGYGEEASGGRNRHSTLGSALEAFCGALYIAHSLKKIEPWIIRNVVEPADAMAARRVAVDYKSKLQEWSQGRGEGLPAYRVIHEGGPDHNKFFVVEVLLGEKSLGQGKGSRKKNAENDAARVALERLMDETNPPPGIFS
jgi:ribonuclease-3